MKRLVVGLATAVWVSGGLVLAGLQLAAGTAQAQGLRAAIAGVALRAVKWARHRHEFGLLRHPGPSACAFIGATVGLMTLAVGCGGTGPAPTAPNQAGANNPPTVVLTACQVLTSDLVTPVIGDDAKQTRDAQPNPHETQCQFTSSSAAINVMVGDWSVIKPIDSQEQTVSGIGDEAYISPLGLAVRKGSRGFALDASLAFGDFNGSAADSLQAKQDQAEKGLAPKLLAKI